MKPRVRKLLIGGGAILAAGLALVARSRASEALLLPVGAPAPEVVGTDPAGTPVKLSAQRGKFAVVYLYPKDESLGCTKEACAFRDAFDKFVEAGVTIFAVSRDNDASHKGFRDHNHLPFPMVADTSGAVQHAFGVSSVLPGIDIASRVTFLVGPDGKIARVWPRVDPVVNANQVLSAVTEFREKPLAD